jgi:hypothetical protein
MEPIYQQLLKRTQEEISEFGENRRPSRLGRVIGVRRFRDGFGVDKAIFDPTLENVPIFYNTRIDFDFEPVFFELEGKDTPPGYTLVTGGDINTYAALRESRVWVNNEQTVIGSGASASGGLRPNVDAVGLVKTDSLTDAEQGRSK